MAQMKCLVRFNFHSFFLCILIVLIIAFASTTFLQFVNFSASPSELDTRKTLLTPSLWKEVVVADSGRVSPTNASCNFFNCFNVYQCGRSGRQKLSVYVYPPTRYVDEDGVELKVYTKEFLEILEAVSSSDYFTRDPREACVFVPAVDTLSEIQLRKDKVSQTFPLLKYWSSGENHILFNFLPGIPPHFDATLGVARGKAMVAGGSYSTYTYRSGFDVSLPIYNPLHQDVPPSTKSISSRHWFLISSQTNIHRDYREDLEAQVESYSSKKVLVLNSCQPFNISRRCKDDHVFDYPQILSRGRFCLVIRGGRLGQTVLYDAMRSGCVPVIVSDSYVLPFSEVIDWTQAAIRIYEEELPDVVSILEKNVSLQRLVEMQKQVIWLYNTYFASMKEITLTALKIINDRVFPTTARPLADWNQRPVPNGVRNPLFLPLTAPAADGFTAVILTYDRIPFVYQVVENLSKVPSISKILVIWNNQNKKPPPASSWPKIAVPLKIIESRANKLSNRFHPYEEIETECILAIDDDINMMTADELEFGYHVWREFPDRIVGFPSRNVVWSNLTKSWKYDSEWTNEVSMVLTGVAFYHKYWSFVYSSEMPGDLKGWVDSHMNCEDIAMNFLVANRTGKAPIKVTPRKKFKCGECTNGDLSGNEAHMMERSQCVNYFSKVFGRMPLNTVEFRADPVLFKEKLPAKVKLYNNVGTL